MTEELKTIYFLCLVFAYVSEQHKRILALEHQSKVLAARLDEFYQAEPKQQVRPLQVVKR